MDFMLRHYEVPRVKDSNNFRTFQGPTPETLAMVSKISNILAGVIAFTIAASPRILAASCPPLKSSTVQVTCTLDGRPTDCVAQRSAPGTQAAFQCKPLHHFLFDYVPAAGYKSLCGQDGQWSERPFRCVPVCGRPTGKPTALVRDGEKVSSAADFPWHTTIYDVALGKRQICGGSLITSQFVVSAAHCFHDNRKPLPPSRYLAAFAKTKRSAAVEEANVQYREFAKIHLKDYGAMKLQYANDIALVELVKEVDVNAWTLPVCVDWGLELPDIRDHEEGIVIGYGGTAERPSEELLFARLPFVRSDECRKLVPDKLAIFSVLPDKYCVGFVNGTTVAKGDSGGGMSFAAEDRSWFLRGIVSVGSPSETTYSYFTNVSAFIPWISGVIKQGEVSGRRCGVDVIEASLVDGAPVQPQDFPWEVDVYYKQTSNRNFERLWTGVLVQPNLVITAVLYPSSEGGSVDLSEYPATWLRVAPRPRGVADPHDLSRASTVSEVVRVFYPGDVQVKLGLIYNFILLELKQPLNLMPVCLDWTGSVLLNPRESDKSSWSNTINGTTMLEKPTDNRAVWKRHPIYRREECMNRYSFPTPPEHNFCTILNADSAADGDFFASGGLPIPALSRAMLVSVDDSWFLRGVFSQTVRSKDYGQSYLSNIYTDMSDPGVRQWLARTRDMIGKSTCGDVNLCKPLTPGLALPGHMPWTVTVEVRADSGGSVSRGAGMLIQPNAVLTDCGKAWPAFFYSDRVDLLGTHPRNFVVKWTDEDGSNKTSRVREVTVHPDSFLELSSDRKSCFVLLELHPEDAIFLTPICLDLSGDVLHTLGPGQLGLVETWSELGPANHSLISTPFVDYSECVNLLLRARNKTSIELNEFCTTVTKDSVGQSSAGGGYLVHSGSRWFLQGLLKHHAPLRRSTDLMLAVEFRDQEVRSWLRRELQKIGTVHSPIPENTGPKNCQGGRPPPFACGIFTPVDEDLAGEEGLLDGPTQNHMEWNVDVHVDSGDGRWAARAGTLVKTTMVLTASSQLATDGAEPSATIPTSDVMVKYISADRRDRRIAEVEHIHVRGGLALLELKSALSLVPACIPAPGSIGQQLLPLGEGAKGLVEVWQDIQTAVRTLVPTAFLTAAECRNLMPDLDGKRLADDRFCAQSTAGTEGDLTFQPGASYSMQASASGAWYLRGVESTDWRNKTGGRQGVHSFYSLDEKDVLEWLDGQIHQRANPTPGNAPIPQSNASATTLKPTVTSTTTRVTKKTTTPTPTPTSTTRRPSATNTRPTAAPQQIKCGQAAVDAPAADGSPVSGHFPWSVGVSKRGDDGRISFSGGVLLRHDLVITAGQSLVNGRWNDSGDALAVDTDRLRVVWASPDGVRLRTGVKALHVRERDRGPRSDNVVWDVALLELSSSLSRSPVACLDLAKDVPRAPLPGELGVMETWRNDFYNSDTLLMAAPYLSTSECRRRLGNMTNVPQDRITSDRFCTDQVSDPVWDGAGYLLRTGDSWELRGVKSCNWGASRGPYGFVDLTDPVIRAWMREKMKTGHPSTSDLSALYFPEN